MSAFIFMGVFLGAVVLFAWVLARPRSPESLAREILEDRKHTARVLKEIDRLRAEEAKK